MGKKSNKKKQDMGHENGANPTPGNIPQSSGTQPRPNQPRPNQPRPNQPRSDNQQRADNQQGSGLAEFQQLTISSDDQQGQQRAPEIQGTRQQGKKQGQKKQEAQYAVQQPSTSKESKESQQAAPQSQDVWQHAKQQGQNQKTQSGSQKQEAQCAVQPPSKSKESKKSQQAAPQSQDVWQHAKQQGQNQKTQSGQKQEAQCAVQQPSKSKESKKSQQAAPQSQDVWQHAKQQGQNQKTQSGQKQEAQCAVQQPSTSKQWKKSQQAAPQSQDVWQHAKQQGQNQKTQSGQKQEAQCAVQQPSTSKQWKKSQQAAPQSQDVWQHAKQQGQNQKTQSGSQKPSSSKDSQKLQQAPRQEQSSMSNQQSSPSPTTNMPHLLCPYKGPGTRGTKFKSLLETNYLKLIINKMKDNAYHYDVVIEPDKPKKHMSKIFQQFCLNNFPGTGIAFDGVRNAYAPMILSLNEIQREVDFTHPETGGVRKYLVNIKETEDMEISLKSLKTYQTTRQYDMPKKALQCVEIILKGVYQQKHLEMGIQAARSFYLPPNKPVYLGDFFELWLGLFQSTVLGSHIYLNVDVAHKAFPERYGSLVELLQQIQKERSCDERSALNDMRSHLSGLDIIYKTPSTTGKRRVYKFMNLVGNPYQERFKDSNGREVTVAAYFNEQKLSIDNPDLPCIKLGNTIKSITVPMEHCSLSDRQAINRKCTENQTRALIKEAATSTDIRKQKIMDLLGTLKHNQSPIIRGFGLELDTNFEKVPARCLIAPKIQYSGNKLVEVRNGVWRGEGMPFLIPESANKWAILNINSRTRNNELQDLSLMLPKLSRQTNLNLAEKPTFVRTTDNRNIDMELENAKKEGIRILFCVIPDSGPTYAKVKQLAEIKIGVLTQCIKGGTVFKKRNDGSTISNILLKCNAKLNGTNHRLNDSPILYDKCMLIGGDVTHPSPDQRNIPSVVGVAASHDVNAFCYNVCWRLQDPRVEIIEDFCQIVLEHLQFYQKKNGHLPNKILYYRDGVSEGQFQQVMASEKMAMVQACARIKPGYEKQVKLTIIIVQKRHHTRFFPGKTEIGVNDRRNNNVPAGTIVDTQITHPTENHFYLVSHQSIQGVAKPTKYCVLLDEANHSIDDLQELSYNLCHLFSRCNRSVSYPAPTYYAHLAAYRGRVYIENQNLNMKNLAAEWGRRSIRDDIAKMHPMFFV